MVEGSTVQQLLGKKLNMDTHYSLLEDRDLIYLLNGDISGQEGSNNWFVQNQLGNEMCYEFPEDFTLMGRIKLDGSDQALFFSGPDYDEIGIITTDECSYTTVVTGTCLNFNNPIRGVYKFNNKENDRRIYFIDGDNPNRYLDIDRPFPQKYLGTSCDSCNMTPLGTLDCEQLNINKNFKLPCLTIDKLEQGQLQSGVYQIGLAYGVDDLVLTDYYFSPAIRIFSESSNIALKLEFDCVNTPFDQYFVVLVSNTRENSLVTYNIGSFPISINQVTISNVENATILSTSTALQKRPIFDNSEHIATNGEILLLGKHSQQEILNYQPQALDIVATWAEIKVPKDEAFKYPSFLRDEVYSLAIEWFGTRGNSRGVFHIPGRAPSEDDLLEFTGDNFVTTDIYEIVDCTGATLKAWQIENTAYVEDDWGIDCQSCSGNIINKTGKMGYWESEDFVYPDDEDTWGDLACQPIRHHRMPAHNLTHIHDDYTIEVIEADPADCYIVEVPDQEGNTVNSYEYCPSGEAKFVESDCVNVLGLIVEFIEHPTLPGGGYDPDISGYRILVGDRKGNKSILHKGLIYNVWKDTSTAGSEILYPNYPFNDLHGDVFLSTVQTTDNSDGSSPEAGWLAPQSYTKNHFTYHSPDIHFREIKQEFGTELKVYGEEIGWIEGSFKNVYQHPMTRLGIGSIQTSPYFNHATQLNSVCHYGAFDPWTTQYFSRFEIQASQYLLPVNQLLSTGKKFNNTLRESSYYLQIGRTLDNPSNIDTSRLLATETGYSGIFAVPDFNYFDTVKRVDGGIIDDLNLQGVSYYVGIKTKLPNQYGGLEQISYRPGGCITSVYFDPDDEIITPYTSPVTYGGDVFISKHSLVRKMPMFTEWLSDVPIDTEINYRDYRNTWYPRFWYDNLSTSDDQYNLDGFTDLKGGADILAYGKFYVFVSGVIHYWCESEFIGDYREQDSTINGTFYPKVDFNDIVRSDRFPYDNKYLYNLTLLNNEIERVYQNLDPTESDSQFTVSYSLKNDLQSSDDRWLQFLPLNYTILPRIYGRFSAMHYTDDYAIMFAFENTILYSQLNFTLNTNEGNSVLITQGDIFSNRLRKLSNESTGFVGCVDPESFVNTRFGTFFFDRYRRKFFQWNGQSVKDVTDTMQSWFHHFVGTDYPGYTYNGIKTVFDNFTENIYLTGGTERNRWTLSYKPRIGGFISFHSFAPTFYFTDSNTYLTSDITGIWKHNSEFNYQTYYDTQYPFECGLIINNKYKNSELQSVELYCEFMEYLQYGSPIYKKNFFFDKVFAYNNNGSTGLMDVFLKDKHNPNHMLIQNSDNNNPTIMEVSQVGDSIYRFNKFESFRVDHYTNPLITLDNNGFTYTVESVDPTLAPLDREDIKGKWVKLHLISDTNTDTKILLQLLVPNQDELYL